MRIAITGASGFLGRELVRQAAGSDLFEVVAVSTRPQQIQKELVVDVMSADDLALGRESLRGIDLVLNCAFPRNEDSLAMPLGLDYVQCVFSGVARSEGASLINVSSQSVYSQRRTHAATELEPICLESKYAVAKYGVEMLADALCAGVPHANVRLASLIGPGFDQRLPNKFAKKAILGQDIVIEDRGSRYGYMSVYDAAGALLVMSAADPLSWAPVYNLGARGTASIPDMAHWANDAVVRLGGAGSRIIETQNFEEAPVDTDLDSSLFESQFSWRPRYSVKEEIDRIVDFEMGL